MQTTGEGNARTYDIVLPAYNEGTIIESTLREFYQAVSLNKNHRIRFIVCEDGSTDNTVAVLQRLALDLPIFLIQGSKRKGYSRAVLDGFHAATAEVVGFIDSDGQCDPKDFEALLGALALEKDLVVGFRDPRSDHWIRLLMSRSFCFVYKRLFPVRLKDPSCPYLLIRRTLLSKILASTPSAILREGFWWEFFARALALGAQWEEVPVAHRVRSGGQTQVYRPTKVPKIAYTHLKGLWALKRELSNLAPGDA